MNKTHPLWLPRYTLTPAIARALMDIEAARAVVEQTTLPPAAEAQLRHRARIRSTHYSTSIEGNRLITSPGGLLPNVSIEDLGTGVSELRNKVVGKILNESGLIEGYGTGVLRIRKYIQEKGLIQPQFKENNGFFKAIFFNAKVAKEGKEGEVGKELKEVDGEVEKLTENQKMILELIRKNPHVSKLEMSKVIGIRVSCYILN